MEQSIDAIRAHEVELTCALIEGLGQHSGVTVYGPLDPVCRTATVSFTVAGRRVSEIGLQLDEEFGVLCRVGYTVAPAAHRTLGTFPEGTVRFAPGLFTSLDDIRARSPLWKGSRARECLRCCPVSYHIGGPARRENLVQGWADRQADPHAPRFSSDCGIALRFDWIRPSACARCWERRT